MTVLRTEFFIVDFTMNDNSIMPFGKHAGTRMKDVPNSYLMWIYNNEFSWVEDNHPDVLDYIEDNLDGIES